MVSYSGTTPKKWCAALVVGENVNMNSYAEAYISHLYDK